MQNIKKEKISKICKKHPQWKDLFFLYLDIDENLSIKELEKTFSLIISHKLIFKNLIDDAKSFLELNDNRSVLERLNDKIMADIHSHKKEKFIKSLKTEKYQHLFNEKVEQEIHTILDNKIPISSLKNQFFNKLAKYKNSSELIESLQSFKNKNIQWNREYYENLIKEKNLNVDILDDQNKCMMIQVNDYESCKLIGSQAWCIVQNKNNFSGYTNDYKRQIIALNFNQPIENNTSMIGFTIYINGDISDSYLKNDKETSKKIKDQFQFNSFSKEKIDNILKEKTNKNAFTFICRYGLIDFYDEYINKEDVDLSDNSNDAIIWASVNGHLDIVNRLLDDPRVDPSADNNYAIRFASGNGKLNMVNRLLDDPRVDPSDAKNSAIRLASENGHLDVVNRLLDDLRVDPSNKNNFAIGAASFSGHLDVVNRLLDDPRVDPSANNNYAIRTASKNGHLDIVNRLLDDPRVDPSDKNNEVIIWASENGNLDIVNRLLSDPRIDPSDAKNSAIRWASANRHLNIVNRLLDDPRVDPSANNNYAIRTASKNGHLDIVNRLLDDPRVDPSDKNNEAIRWASENGHLDVVNRLLEDTRVDPSADNNYAIRTASKNGHLDIVNRLLEGKRENIETKKRRKLNSYKMAVCVSILSISLLYYFF